MRTGEELQALPLPGVTLGEVAVCPSAPEQSRAGTEFGNK